MNTEKDLGQAALVVGHTGKEPSEPGWVKPQAYDYASLNDPKSDGHGDSESDGARYVWKDEYGDVGPRDEMLEKALFGSESRPECGDGISAIEAFRVTSDGPCSVAPVKSFEDAGLHPVMVENVKLCKYITPTPIQKYCIPALVSGYDVVAVAQTGSGKTAAYMVPIISKLMGKYMSLVAPRPALDEIVSPPNKYRAEPLVLIVVPTRELAIQVFDEARRLAYRSMLRPCIIYGGKPSRKQYDDLGRGCDILVATPGRLMDIMTKPHILSLSRVKYTVFDEADELLNAQWETHMRAIFSGGDTNMDDDHVYMMFSATFNKFARAVARKYMANDYVRIRVGRSGSTTTNCQQNIIYVAEDLKKQAVYDFILSIPPARVMVFVNSKNGADHLDDYLYNKGLPSTSIHSDRTQLEREDAIRAFRSGRAPIMVATGLSARGIDVKGVMHVINFNLPTADLGGIEEYVHRIGRTARIGNRGRATSFFNERDEPLAPALVKILLETGQNVPDFLEQYTPSIGPSGTLDFEDDTDEDEAAVEDKSVADEEKEDVQLIDQDDDALRPFNPNMEFESSSANW